MTDQSGEVSCGSTSDPSSSARDDRHSNTTSSPASLKCCTICGATKTPLWRGGPSGPKSLCNACGIRYRKERRESMGLSSGVEKKINKTNKGNKHINGSSSKIKIKNKDSKSGGGAGGGGGGKMDVLRLLGFDAEVLLKERSMLWLKRRRRLGEEEEAAVLLMALSSGFL